MKDSRDNFSLVLQHLLKVGWCGQTNRQQKELAYETGIKKGRVWKLVNGIASPTRDELCVLRDCTRLPDYFREIFRRMVDAPIVNSRRGPSAEPPAHNPPASFDLGYERQLDADGNGVLDENDAVIHSRRATRVLEIMGAGEMS